MAKKKMLFDEIETIHQMIILKCHFVDCLLSPLKTYQGQFLHFSVINLNPFVDKLLVNYANKPQISDKKLLSNFVSKTLSAETNNTLLRIALVYVV